MYRRFYETLALLVLLAAAGCAGRGRTVMAPETGQQRLHAAIELQEKGHLEAALAEFGRALEENPNLTEAHLGMGNIFRERGDLGTASAAYQRAVETNPEHFDANYYLGLMRQMLGKIQLAIVSYRKAIALQPDSAIANRDLASAYLQVGNAPAALPYARRAVSLDRESQAAWCNLAACHNLMGDFPAAIDAYREAAELDQVPPPLLPGLADAHLRLGNFQRAINVLRSLIKQAPSATAHERLGYALFKARKFDEALEHYEVALQLSPNDTAALNGLGACLLTKYIQSDRKRIELRDAAFNAWRRSVKLRPDQERIVDLLARYSVL